MCPLSVSLQCGVCKGQLGDTTTGTDVRIRNGLLNCHQCYIRSRCKSPHPVSSSTSPPLSLSSVYICFHPSGSGRLLVLQVYKLKPVWFYAIVWCHSLPVICCDTTQTSIHQFQWTESVVVPLHSHCLSYVRHIYICMPVPLKWYWYKYVL